MTDKKTAETTPAIKNTTGATVPAMFGKSNYTMMIVGLAVIALGMVVMAGGKGSDAAVFDQKEVYSTTRITIAPLLILLGLGLEVFAIFRKQK